MGLRVHYYASAEAAYQRGEWTEDEWQAFQDGYARAEQERQRAQAPVPQVCEEDAGFVWGRG